MHRYSIIVKSLFIQRHCRAALPCAGWKIVAISVTAWWCHQMETFSALLAFCVGNSPSTGEFPAQRPVTQSFDIFFDLRLNKRLSKQSWGWWIKAPSRSLWGLCDGQSAGLMITCSTKYYDQDLSTVHMIYATNFRVFFVLFWRPWNEYDHDINTNCSQDYVYIWNVEAHTIWHKNNSCGTTHENGKVVRVRTLVFTGEACLQRPQWMSGLSSWRPFRFSAEEATSHHHLIIGYTGKTSLYWNCHLVSPSKCWSKSMYVKSQYLLLCLCVSACLCLYLSVFLSVSLFTLIIVLINIIFYLCVLKCLYILPMYILCTYSFMYWKSGTSDLLMLMLFVLQCTDYK